MTCEWCGSSRHPSSNCPTRNLVLFLQDKPPESWDAKLPDQVIVLSEKDFLNEVEARSKLRKSSRSATE